MCDKDISQVQEDLEPFGMEVYVFKVGWYNDNVDKIFALPYNYDTACAVVLTAPAFFEKCFLPFLRKSIESGEDLTRDPIDRCIACHVSNAVKKLHAGKLSIMYDYEMDRKRRPKVLMQTAAHVAGAAFYYNRNNTISGGEDPWGPDKHIFGISLHPRYGGWFAIRSVVVFEEQLTCAEYREPLDCVPSRSQKIDLLNRFNDCWRDWSYRDVIPVEERYSDKQKRYFGTPPKNRNLSFLKSFL